MEAARLDLMASKQKLEEDIRVKKNSIAIDQVFVSILMMFCCLLGISILFSNMASDIDFLLRAELRHYEPASRSPRSAVLWFVARLRGGGSEFQQRCEETYLDL